MENRWVVLLLTVLVSAGSFAIFFEHHSFVQEGADLVGEALWKGQIVIPSFIDPFQWMFFTVLACSFAWCYPFALRLGWLRAGFWIGLTAVNAQIELLIRDRFFVFMGEYSLPILLPCLALVGRRTRPWMAIPASAAYSWVWFKTGPYAGYSYFTLGSILALPYAAILIFGTKLIPKKPATAATSV